LTRSNLTLVYSIYSAVYIPTLEILCYSLEAANSHPSFALEHLRDLAHDVEKIGDHLDLIDEHFAKGKDEDEIVRDSRSLLFRMI